MYPILKKYVTMHGLKNNKNTRQSKIHIHDCLIDCYNEIHSTGIAGSVKTGQVERWEARNSMWSGGSKFPLALWEWRKIKTLMLIEAPTISEARVSQWSLAGVGGDQPHHPAQEKMTEESWVQGNILVVTPPLPRSWMKPSSCAEGHRNSSGDKSPCLDPKFKNRFRSINQDLLCNSKCWCTWASVGDSKLRSWTRNKSCILVSNSDVQLQCVTSRPQLCHWVLKIFKITFSFQKLFKHTLFIYIGSRVLIYT